MYVLTADSASWARAVAARFSAASFIAFDAARWVCSCCRSTFAVFHRSTAASNWAWSCASCCFASSTCCWDGAAAEVVLRAKTNVGTTTTAAISSRFTLVEVPVIVLRGSGYSEGPVKVTEPSADTLATPTVGRQSPTEHAFAGRTTDADEPGADRDPRSAPDRSGRDGGI